MNEPEWIMKATAEISQARVARTACNQGQARVCARRAAGWLLRVAYNRQHQLEGNLSAYDLISKGSTQPDFPLPVRRILGDMLQRVQEGGGFPQEIDLIAACLELASLLAIDLPNPSSGER